MRRAASLAFLASAVAGGAGAVDVRPAAQLASASGPAEVGARAAAIGGAFVGIADDSTAIFANPAGLSTSEARVESSLHDAFLLGGVAAAAGTGAWKAGRIGTFGVGVRYVAFGSYDLRAADGSLRGTYAPSDATVAAGVARRVVGGLHAGASLEAGQLVLTAASSYTRLAVNAGLLWAAAERFRLAAAVTGLGTTVGGAHQETGWWGGAAWDVRDKDTDLVLAYALEEVPGGMSTMHLGIEDRPAGGAVALRGGYRYRIARLRHPAAGGMTLGAGVVIRSFALDYAFIPYDELGATHQLSLTFRGGRPR